MSERRLILIAGIVQGVGFRPFVYQLAEKYSLSGWVKNDSDGVKIDVQGTPENLSQFYRSVTEYPPQLARIDSVHSDELVPELREGFRIRQSHQTDDVSVSVTPDQSICPACRDDIHNPGSRYYHYPFTNCTNCGPRYSIIRQLPYDRCQTSMQMFEMCPECQHEYQDPGDRRYHAQPVSCPQCGPAVYLLDPLNQQVAEKDQAITQTASLLSQGKVLAIKGTGGFHLVCDARHSGAVSRLRTIKQRQLKPFAVMAASQKVAEQYVNGCESEWKALSSSAAPIVLMNRKINSEKPLASEVAPVGPYIGMMLPNTPLHVLLFDALEAIGATQILVMTSANRSGLPLASDHSEVYGQFGEELDGVLDHNRAILNPCDDSLVHFAGGEIRILRMARGYAPLSVKTDYQGKTLLAMGAQQKSSIAVATKRQWFLSPHIGDIDDLDTQIRYQQSINVFQQLYHCQPRICIHDLHPGYFSSQIVSEYTEQSTPVQHHYAHVLAVMAEHRLTQTVLAFAFDGTGMGDDETVWGGEVLLADAKGYQRCGHLRPFRLIGGEKAIHEPSRILLAMLLECYAFDDVIAMHHPAFSQWSERDLQNLYQLWRSGRNSPYCTSVGRLFDAWASLLGLVEKISFEGESGLRIEALSGCCSIPNLSGFELLWTEHQVLDWQPALNACIGQKVWQQADDRKVVCQTFIHSLASAIYQLAGKYPSYPVVVCGGVFQNRLLMDLLWQKWHARSQPLYSGGLIPVNDGGIAAGQVWYGMHSGTE